MNILASKRFIFVVVIAIYALAGCQLSERLDDVSSQKEYGRVVGKEYVLKQDLLTYEIRSGKDRSSEAAYYLASTYPGISGPEVKKIGLLRAGKLIKVKKVLRCKNCVPSLDYFVIGANDDYPAMDFRVRSVGNQPVSNVGKDGFVRLNPDIFVGR